MSNVGLSLAQVVQYDPELAKKLVDAGADIGVSTVIAPVVLKQAGADVFVRYQRLANDVAENKSNAEAKGMVVASVGAGAVVGSIASFLGFCITDGSIATGVFWGLMAGGLAACSVPSPKR